MSEYPSTQPFGPHGPQVPAHSVTPNPTAQTPQGMPGGAPDYSVPRVEYGEAGGGYAARPKSMITAVVLSIFLGPIGVIYATLGTRQYRWAVAWLIGSVTLMFAIGLPLAPILAVSLIWSVLAVRSQNE